MKLQNALLQRDEDESGGYEFPLVKICDFGLSHRLDP
jgi:serine/threonine protein kinase